MMPPSLGPGREFDLIRSLPGFGEAVREGVRLGPGDDCAILDNGTAVSVDLSVEGVHFRREWISLQEAGYRAVAGALSDLAAVGAAPLGVLLSLAVLPEEAGSVAPALQRGALDAASREGVGILGGDLSRSPGPVFMDVTVLGRSTEPLLRGGCRPGDEVWVTGWLGGSAAALALWEAGVEPPGPLRAAFAAPAPRIREVLWLRERGPIHGAVDLSDGLAGDGGHLASAGGVALVLERGRIPLHPGVEEGVPDPEDRLRMALHGGEDYEVCFTAPPGWVEEVAGPFQAAFGTPLRQVGWVEEGEGVYLQDPHGKRVPAGGGHDHLQEDDGR